MGFLDRASLRARAAAQAAQAARIKAALAPLLSLSEDDVLSVHEIACADPGCPDIETVVLVMRVGEPTRAIRIKAPAEAVSQEHLSGAAEDERRQRSAG